MSLGVAIPTYIKHYPFLPSLLENITSSTVKPDAISVSCSSMIRSETVQYTLHGVPVTVSYSILPMNPSQNRNRAISKLNTDLVMMLDGDDLMHPQRIEYVKNAFAENPDIQGLYHGYLSEPLAQRGAPFVPLRPPVLIKGCVKSQPHGVGLVVDDGSGTNYDLHHAHGTFRRDILRQFPFDERPEYKYAEDSIHATVLEQNNVELAYLANPLTRYISGTR